MVCTAVLDGRAGGLGDLIKRLGDLTLAEACGNMSGFVMDPSWHELNRRLRNGLIAPTDEEGKSS
jgi:hypothetical protein